MNKGFYLKLALSNLRRNRKFYAPYLLASVVTVAMCYIILALNSGHMLDGMRGETIMRSYMALGGVVVLIFAAIFLFYTNSFLTRRRRQEFGLYSILGMEKRHIARLLSVETLMLFAASLGLGLGLGVLLSKLVGLGALIPHGYGLTIAAALLNSPAYGLFTLYMVTTGWGITAPPWAGYVGALVSGLLPPLLYLIGSYLPIRALDEVEENVEI